MAKKLVNTRNHNRDYFVFSLIPVAFAVLGFIHWQNVNRKLGEKNHQNESSGPPIDYSLLDKSICLFKTQYCEAPEKYRRLVDCFHSEDIKVYYLKNQSSCVDCMLTPGFLFPTDAEDTSKIVKCLANTVPRVPFRVRSGAHSFSGTSFIQEGFIVDMKRLGRISVKPKKKEVTVGVGNRVGEIYKALEKHNLLMIGGDCPDVGIGGLSSTGGTGFTTRKYGILINSILNYQIVLATGEIVNASYTENRDLFDVLRGGGASSFGILTQVTMKLAPLEPQYGLIRIKIDKKGMGEWIKYFLSISKTFSEDVMYLYTYLFADIVMIQGAITGDSFASESKQRDLIQELIGKARNRSITIIDGNVYKIPYTDLYKYTYGKESFVKATSPKSTWMRDFRQEENSKSVGIMSGYICTDDIPLEVFEHLEEHYYNPEYRAHLEHSDLGTNIELFGGKEFPDEAHGIYAGKGCNGIVTTYPKFTNNMWKNDLIQRYLTGFWNILRPYTNYSYRGYEDLSNGRTDQRGHVGLMDLHFADKKYQAMEAKTKYDPMNVFKNQISIPTLDCYEKNICL